jgi:hypothetical protein
MNKEQAINNFWNSFGIPAYDENSVPNNIEFPYITFNVSTSNINNVVSLYANVWDRSTSWKRATEIAEQIAKFIGYGHYAKKFDGGYIYITLGSPFAQRMEEPGDNLIKRIYINIEAEFLSSY